MLSLTHYAQNYASIIDGSLPQGGHTKRLHKHVHMYKPAITHIKLTLTHANTHTLAINSKITNAHRHINTDSLFKSICVNTAIYLVVTACVLKYNPIHLFDKLRA